ncbi:MAG: stage 0 sporulation protein [Candidatus Marinimicrobia bacterium]|nr:stage 0 sporulation protein [Candidatus Neomarinimicrobiota bacterium]MCF7830126.1 stage 0 sporulation protein [Candidatus Neomarinimicrobiota bacterium]MCF7882203.1 stage 0 sporulation protein [Candidatus Neomarinimicrobiota bacterium]
MAIATDTAQQTVFVEFKGNRRGSYLYTPGENKEPIERGDQIIVETDEHGEDSGIVTHICPKCDHNVVPDKKVLRKLSPADYAHLIDNQEKEEEAWEVCQERIEALDLDMKLTDIEFQFDRKKVTFYYTADERVDFRQLVRDLAAIYRTRIEMRQIGVRDEAKRHDGVGVCGNRICCSSFMEGFEPVNTQLAKDQGLPLNPSKLTGMCGKLKCCLRYEYSYYEEKMDDFPEQGEIFDLPEGKGRVNHIDIFNDIVHFWLTERAEMVEKPLSELNNQSKTTSDS